MNNQIIRSALIAYLQTELTPLEKEEDLKELEKFQETSKAFWSEFLDRVGLPLLRHSRSTRQWIL